MPADEPGRTKHAKTLHIRGPEPLPPTEPTPPPTTHSAHPLLVVAPAHLWPEVPGYEILGELGHGGMGVVYKARQERLNRAVAVKMLLNPRFADMSDVVRFRSEAEAVAAVAHPHVVKVFESGQHDGQPYFVMEYLHGGTLHARLRAKAPLAPDVSSELVEKLARAVHAAHQQGIIHRDLKPGNVLFDADGEPRVTDFGLAKRSSQELTKTQVVMGTPAYMPPEQAAGRAKYAGPPADIYALGVILYECLTGHTPFTGDDSVVMMAQVISEPPPSPRSKVANLPRDLELICLKCLEKDPADRYQTAAQLAEDLRRFLNREPVSVRPAGAIERAVKWAKRRPTLASAYGLAVVAVVLLLFGGGMFTLWQRAETARDKADANLTSAEGARAEADASRQATENARALLAQQNGKLEQSLERETTAKAAAEKARGEADKARADVQRLAYFHDVGLAYNEARAGNVHRAHQLLVACPPAAREWEWHFTDRLARPELWGIGCRYRSNNVAYTKDGVCLFEPTGLKIPFDATGRPGKPVQVTSAAYQDSTVTPDGQRFVGIAMPADKTKPGTLEVWRTADGKRLASWSVPNTHILFLTASDGGRVVAGFHYGKLMAFDPAEKEPLWSLDNLVSENHHPHLSPDGNWIVVDSSDDMALVDVGKGRVTCRMTHGSSRMKTSAVSPDGTRIVVGNWEGDLAWFVRGEKKPTRVTAGVCAGGVNSVTFSPDGKKVACGGLDGAVRLFAADTGAELAVFRGHRALTTELRFNPTGTELVTTANDMQCICWAVDKPQTPIAELPLPPNLPRCIQVEVNLTRLFAYRPNSGDPGVLCAADGRDRTAVPLPVEALLNSFDFQPGGKGFACGSGHGPVEHWPDPAGPPVLVADHKPYVCKVQYSGDGRMLLSASDGLMCVWDTVAKKQVWRQDVWGWHDWAISPDGKRVAVAHANKYRVFDLASGKSAEWLGMSWMGVMQFTSDSTSLLVGSGNWGVSRYTLGADGKLVGEPRHYLGHSSMVRSVAVSANGKRLAAGGTDGVVKVWDNESGQELLALTARDRKAITHLSFTADGRLVAGFDDGPPVVFDGRPRSTSR